MSFYLKILTITRFEVFPQKVALIYKKHFSGIQQIFVNLWCSNSFNRERREERHPLLMKAFKTWC